MWDQLTLPWQEAFGLAWTSYLRGSNPIGSVIVDSDMQIITRGRNTIYDSAKGEDYITSNNLAHAEINAMLKLDINEHKQRNTYFLYSTLEPCPQCFGALYMSGIKKLSFAARDRHAGSVNLYGATEYMKAKKLTIEGPFTGLEEISIALIVSRDIEVNKTEDHWLHDKFYMDSPLGVQLGRNLAKERRLITYKESGTGISEVLNNMYEELQRFF